MNAVVKLLCAVLASGTAFGLWTVFQFVYHQLTSPIRHLRGPKGTSWIYGNMRDIWNAENSVLHEEWVKQYGNTLKYKGFFNSDRLFTMDMRVINHVLTHSNDYEKPSQVRYNLSQILGEGLLFVEGSQHRQQNPAFGPAQIRGLTDIFLEKSLRLRDVLSSEIAKDPVGTTPSARIDIMPWLSRTTLDIIGLAGFNYNFDSLNANEKPNELNGAFSTMVDANQSLSILTILRARLPPSHILPNDRARRIQVARRTMARIGNELLSDAKAAAHASATEKGEIEKNSLHGRDLLSLLVKANMATDIPESQRLSDEDVLARTFSPLRNLSFDSYAFFVEVPTFLVAGHETTSTAVTWALFAMTKAPEIQVKLREELLSVDTETPSMDELMALPYLDAVVRETLRVHSPVPNTLRFATKDDVIPIEKPYTDKYGVMHDSIRPERWQSIPEAVSHIPGVWGHLMSFLGGPRACIGYRFSLVEMKAILFTLVQRPVLRSDPNNKSQLPLLIQPYRRT
ncbi:cytochrome P450 [Boletus edulis]|nr:cytochrome P450 [Boletus edulis]